MYRTQETQQSCRYLGVFSIQIAVPRATTPLFRCCLLMTPAGGQENSKGARRDEAFDGAGDKQAVAAGREQRIHECGDTYVSGDSFLATGW